MLVTMLPAALAAVHGTPVYAEPYCIATVTGGGMREAEEEKGAREHRATIDKHVKAEARAFSFAPMRRGPHKHTPARIR